MTEQVTSPFITQPTSPFAAAAPAPAAPVVVGVDVGSPAGDQTVTATISMDSVRSVLSAYGVSLKTADQIKEMTPQELQAYADSLQEVKSKVSLEGARLQAQLEGIDSQLETARASAQAEFGTSTLEGLEGIRTQLLSEIQGMLQ